MRKLASVQKILSLSPIEGADKIELARVLGWNVVVEKDKYKVGEMVVYCEIDSILPKREEFMFLEPRGMRIRTIKLRGQVSQGICFPLSVLPENLNIEEDMDVTFELGVIKYEPPIPANLAGRVKGNFPSFIPKTDETRVQTMQKELNKYVGHSCYITEKLDGSSATFYIKDGSFGVCSRNLDILESEDNSFWKVARELNIEEKLKQLNGNYAFQGELIGEGVQKNKYGLKGQTVRFFNIFDIDKFEYFSYDNMVKTYNELELQTVPIVDDNYILVNDIDTLVNLSIDKSKLASIQREGIVIRLKELQNSNLISFKSINPKFLLAYGDE